MKMTISIRSMLLILLASAAYSQETAPTGQTEAKYSTPEATPIYPAYGGKTAPYHKNYHEDKFARLPVDPKHPVDFLPDLKRIPKDGGPVTLNDLSKLGINDFLPESRDIFHLMDQVMTDVLVGGDGKVIMEKGMPVSTTRMNEFPGSKADRRLQPLAFNLDGTSERDQRAVYGRNTWLMWCGGNEDFWDWLSQNGYGVLDFLHAIDSRKRSSRLAKLGLINQPGLVSTGKPGPWGLYLDKVEKRLGEEDGYSPYKKAPEKPTDPNELESDGVDPKVYGYPSGVIGFRLFPNPKFDAEAQKRWNAEAFYNDHAYATDPRTVRPFTVGMTCAVCHVSLHPMNPPLDAEEPKWSNLSSIVGAQYFRTAAAFGSRVERGNFLYQYLASQQPGTIDTSMTVTDQINNSNAMNGVYELPARVERAKLNPSEKQYPIALSMPGGERDQRVARVLMDGADSIGIFPALSRVYLNIGLYGDEWRNTSNMILGFAPQKPFSIDLCRKNSLYWRVNENFRISYLQDFFLWEKKSPTEYRSTSEEPRYQCSTQAMLLNEALVPERDVPSGYRSHFPMEPLKALDLPLAKRMKPKEVPPAPPPANNPPSDDPEVRKFREAQLEREKMELRGSRVFTGSCMICHSSKQPEGFEIKFSHEPPNKAKNWAEAMQEGSKLTLPSDFENWETFKNSSPAYKNYLEAARKISGDGDPQKLAEFLKDNFLSTDLRIPITLTQTNAGRAVATNALKGQVWAEFASKTYHNLAPVGKVTYKDPITRKEAKIPWEPHGGGPGYYRVPSLVSIWNAAPLLHNNALGKYIPDERLGERISLAGRVDMFDDAAEKLLWKSKRSASPSGEGGLRGKTDATWHGADVDGWIFRTDVETEFRIPSGHLHSLVIGAVPGILPGWSGKVALKALDMPRLIPLVLALLTFVLIWFFRMGFYWLLVITGFLIVVLLAVTGIHHLLPWVVWLIPLALIAGGLAWILTTIPRFKDVKIESTWKRVAIHIGRWVGAATYAMLLIGLFALLWIGQQFVNGNLGDLRLGPFPKGMPVNAVMNLDPEAPLLDRLGAVRGLCSMLGKLYAENNKERDSREERRRFQLKYPAVPEHLQPKLYQFDDDARLKVFEERAGPALIKASKCPDFVLDRGHYFGESLTDDEKRDLIAFLKTL